VVARETDLSAPVSAAPVVHVVIAATTKGRKVARHVLRTSSPRLGLPALPAGFSAASTSPSPYRRWLLAGGESDARTAEVVTVTNPGSAPARVQLADLAGTALRGAGTTILVGAGGSVAIPLSSIRALSGEVSLELTSNVPVLAGQLLYSVGPHPLGLSMEAGIPIR